MMKKKTVQNLLQEAYSRVSASCSIQLTRFASFAVEKANFSDS